MNTEPTLIIQSIVAVLVAIQTAAIPMPAWAHTLIAVAIIALGAILTRANVTPTKKDAVNANVQVPPKVAP